MPRILYNEGRVVGYSAYEIYVRQLYATDPGATPATEKEWLASSLAMGSSLLLRIGADDISGPHYRDIQFPSTSRLSAANTIMASFFLGEGYIGESPEDTNTAWSTRVTDYGNLISNTSSSHPSGTTTHSSSIQTKTDIDISDAVYDQVVSYMNITDGIIIQPGTWTASANKPPEMDFQPTLSDYPMFRVSFGDKVETPFFILLTGFTDRGVLLGESTLTSSTNTNAPQDGDFLGPMVFPWSAKVIFSIPPFAMKTVLGNSFKYKRRFALDISPVTVDATPILDFASYSPDARNPLDPTTSQYGEQYDQSSKPVFVNQMDITRPNSYILSTYSVGGGELPPSLYGAVVQKDESGRIAMYPIDCTAPNTVHVYQEGEGYDAKYFARKLMVNAEGAKAFIRDSDTYTIDQVDSLTHEYIPTASVNKQPISGVVRSIQMTDPFFFVDGTSLRRGLTMKWTGTDYSQTGHIGGTAVPKADVEEYRDDPDNWKYWYIEVDDDISYEYTSEITTVRIYTDDTEYEDVQGIPGATAMSDKIMCAPVGVMYYRRIIGKLSDKIKDNCGYLDVFDANGDPIGVFAEGEIWDSVATRKLFYQIPAAERHNYYAVLSGNGNSAIAYPVKNSDNTIDITFKYQTGANSPLTDNAFNIYVSGQKWNIPHFRNDPPSGNGRDTKYLGTWYNAETNPDDLTADMYDVGWAKIDESGISHPTSYSLIANIPSSQIDQQYGMLPHSDTSSATMLDVFGSTLLDSIGVLSEYQNLTVPGFLQKAMYTDMGTGQELNYLREGNLHINNTIYTNGYDPSTQTYIKSNMREFVSFDVYTSATTTGKTKLFNIPYTANDDNTSDPIGVLVETGRIQSLTLSMADSQNNPYDLTGSSGTKDVDDPGVLTWQLLTKALAENKKLNVIGDNNYIEFNSSSTPLRLYVSTTEPTGTIPEGSIGIGWDTSIHKYTSGAWS